MTAAAINTPKNIIDTAMRHAGKLSEGAVPTSEQYGMYLGDLQRMVNLWQTQGLKLWLQTDLSVTLTAGKGGQGNPYSLSPGGDVNMTKPLRVEQGYFLESAGNRRPLFPLSWEEWLSMSVTTQTGPISQYFIDKQPTQLLVYFWLVPDATAALGTAHLMVQQQVVNPINLTETTNFPAEWGIALVWGLADEICSGQPQTIMDRCQGKAAVYKAELEDWDVEDAPTTFEPDIRGGYDSGMFR